jgi:transposase-like protein
MAAAPAFFTEAIAVVDQLPERGTTDGHDSYPKALAEVLGPDVQQQVSDCLTNRIEQEHRGIKQRYFRCLVLGL